MKKIYALVLVFLMLVSVSNQVVLAENTADAFRVLDFGYYDGADMPIEELAEGTVLKTKLELKKTGTQIERATLITCLLSDGEITDINSVTEVFSEEPYERTLEAVINIPADIEGELSVQSYLWGGWDEMHPLARWSDFDSENAGVYKLYIYDKLIETFIPDGDNNIVLPASTGENPKITAVCEDLGTKVTSEVSDNGDGSKKITITAKPRKGENRTYTVNYTVEEPKVIAQLVYDYNNGAVFEKKTDDIALSGRKLLPPEYQYDDAGNVVDFGDDVMNYITTLYKDTEYGYRMLYVDVPDELKGAEVLHLPSAMRNNLTGESTNNPVDFSDMVVRLTLNKSATFYFPATQATARLSGAQKSTIANSVTWWQVVSGGDFKSPANYKDKAVSVLASRGYGVQPGYQGDYQYELFLEVPEGIESKTFEIPIVGTVEPNVKGSDQFAPLLWLKWAE